MSHAGCHQRGLWSYGRPAWCALLYNFATLLHRWLLSGGVPLDLSHNFSLAPASSEVCGMGTRCPSPHILSRVTPLPKRGKIGTTTRPNGLVWIREDSLREDLGFESVISHVIHSDHSFNPKPNTPPPPFAKQRLCRSNTRCWFRQFLYCGFWWCIFQLVLLCAMCAVSYLGFEMRDGHVLCQGS